MISIENLSAGYGDKTVLRDFSLQVESGQVVAVIGPNGCGKSTMLRCVAGLLAPQSGRIVVNGNELQTMTLRERARLIAMLPQDSAGDSWSELSVEEVVLAGRTPYLPPYAAPRREDYAVVERVMHATDTWNLRERKLHQISGGERQRVGLARALAQEPRVLLLDEPTNNLDLRYQHEILDLALRVARRDSLSVIVVLHELNLAAAMADQMILLSGDGTLRAGGTPQDVMKPDYLSDVYGVSVSIAPHPRSGRPQAQVDWDFD